MKALLFVVVLLTACSSAFAQTAQVISIDLKDASLKDALGQISQKCGVSIVLDPKAEGTVTARIENAELVQALNVVTKANGLTWKKLQFAKPEGNKVSLEQLKSSLLALAAMPVIGLSVEDPTAKTSSVVARDLPATPDVSAIKLPEGYAWSSAYVVLAPEEAKAAATDTNSGKVKEISQDLTQCVTQLSEMTSDERKAVFAQEWVAHMSLTPEARQSLMRDRLDAVMALDPQYRGVIREDWHQGYHMLRDQASQQGDQWQPRHGDRNR